MRTLEVLVSGSRDNCFQLSDSGARTFDGLSWVPMGEMGDSGIQYCEVRLVPHDEIEDFVRRALGTQKGFTKFVVHVSTVGRGIGVWAKANNEGSWMEGEGWAVGRGDLARLKGPENELPARVAEAVLAALVMGS
jgi:hypothetical protein